MTRLRWIFFLFFLPSISSEIAPSIEFESIPRPIMPTTCHMLSCMPGMVCRMTEPAVCKSHPCDTQPTCVEGESNEESIMGEGTLLDPIADKLGEHSTSPEEPMRRHGPQSSLSSNWSRGGSAPLLDADTTKLMEGAREKLMRAVMNQQPSSTSVGEFVIDLICLIRGTCQCNSNERYVTCGGCEGTCANPTPSCPSGCSPSRCECLPGFVRYSSVCIPSRDCPTQPTRPSRPPTGPWSPRPPGAQNCGRDEEWDQCGTQCEASCADTTPPACPPQCDGSGGCRCRLDLVRDWNGRCNPASSCGGNQPTTTWAPNDWLALKSPSFPGRVNDFVMKDEDEYKDDYEEEERDMVVKREIEEEGREIRRKEEDIEEGGELRRKEEGKVADIILCPSNEEQKKCVTACEPSCGKKEFSFGERLACALSPCLPTQCVCMEGFVRSEGDQCVKEEECEIEGDSKVCPPYQRFNLCGTRCEPSCNQSPIGCGASAGCAPPRCECIPGYVRWNNQCIPASNCPSATPTPSIPSCSRNEVFMRCSSGCEPSCYSPAQNCGSRCYAPSCQCALGYYRRPAPYNDCVLWSQCGWALRREEKPDECRENEEYKQCTKQCEPTCFDRNPKCSSSECGPPGCECSSGYLRISVHESVCIPPEMCPAKKTIWRRG